MKTTRYNWVDIAKGIAIILVLYRHVFEGIKYSGIKVENYLGLEYLNIMLFSFRMPLFFIVSGIFVSYSLKKRELPVFLSDKAKSILYPYFIWGFLQISLQLVFHKYVNGQRELHDYLYLFFVPREVEQFWYLYALFNITVLYAIVKERLKPRIIFQLIAGIIMFAASIYFHRSGINSGFLGDILHYYVFFAIGDSISGFINDPVKTEKFTSLKAMGILFIPFILLQVYFLLANISHAEKKYQFVEYYQPALFLLIALTGCAFITVVSFRLAAVTKMAWLRELGRHSLFIYVAHVIILALTRAFFTHILGIYNVPFLLATGILAGLLVPVWLYKLSSRWNFKWIFQWPEKKNKQQEAFMIVK